MRNILYYHLNCSLKKSHSGQILLFFFCFSERAAICCSFWWHSEMFRNIWAIFDTHTPNGHQMVDKPHRLSFLSETAGWPCFQAQNFSAPCVSLCLFLLTLRLSSMQVTMWLFFFFYHPKEFPSKSDLSMCKILTFILLQRWPFYFSSFIKETI